MAAEPGLRRPKTVEDGLFDADGECGRPTLHCPRGASPGTVEQMDADHALTATFRYFVGFHSLASRCPSAI